MSGGDADALVAEAYALRRAGDRAGSLRLYREAAAHGDAAGRAHCLRHIGDLARELGDRGAALAALDEAERLYRGEVSDSLSLANTVRLQALLHADRARWRKARRLYEAAAADTGLDLTAAFEECDRHASAGVTEMTGGCQCGRVRYTARIDSDDAYLCHCRMCRRATGGASIAFVNVAVGDLTWETAPDWYRSSPIAHRPFCSACGTPLGFAFLEDATAIDLTLGSFDDPARFKPTHNYATESLLPHWQDTSHLPAMRSDENPNVADRWIKAIGKLPD